MRKTPQISIIIPVLNEESNISMLLSHIKNNILLEDHLKEILVVDGGSSDQTIAVAEKSGATVLKCDRGRAKQMNAGAKKAKGEILYFLHADTLPPRHFDLSILLAIDTQQQAGCFQMKFDSNSLFLKFFAWFSRINHHICRGGDQSLFITNTLFGELSGFNEEYKIYEDNEFIGRLYKKTHFTILPKQVRTSARKYEKRGKIALQYHFGVIHLKKSLGAGPEQLYRYYRRHIA